MSNREFTAQRTMLANAFATAGAELLEYMGVSSALAAIPNTEPQQYVVAGTLHMIAKALPATAAEKPTGDLTDEQIELPPLTDAKLWMTHESRFRLANGGNGKGAVPVHGKRSATAVVPLYTADEMREYARAAIAAHLERQAQAKDRTIIEMCVRIAAPASQEGAHAALEEVRNQALEDAAECLDRMNESSGDAAAYDGREQNSWELSKEAALNDAAAAIRGLKTPASAERSGDRA